MEAAAAGADPEAVMLISCSQSARKSKIFWTDVFG
jgi:hypothetical protein